MVALILADGDVPTRAVLDHAWPHWFEGVQEVIAADGGARHARALGLIIDLWVGDGDSVDPTTLQDLEDAGVEILRARPDKDESDTELAVQAAIARDHRGVVILGATGGPRIDHEIANIALLAMPGLIDRSAQIYTPRSRISLLSAAAAPARAPGTAAWLPLQGAPGDLVSLIPFGVTASGVSTSALAYPLHVEDLPLGSPRGLSNIVTARGGRVSLTGGSLLVIESPATIPA